MACASFQCVKAKTFDEQRLLGPARPDTRSSVHPAAQRQWVCPCCSLKKEQTMQRTQGLWPICKCTNSSCFQPNFWEKSKPAKQMFLYFREQQLLHLSAMCWLCSRGINARTAHGCSSTPLAETFVFMQEGPWPNFLLVHLSISPEKSFLSTVPCVICWIKFFLISRPKPKKWPLEQTRFCANVIPTSPPGN